MGGMLLMKIKDISTQTVYPMIKTFKVRNINEFEHTEKHNVELERLNTTLGWQTKLKLIPDFPDKNPQLEMAYPPDPAIIAYISMMDDRFHRDMYRYAVATDIEDKNETRRKEQRRATQEARTKAIVDSIKEAQLTFESIRQEIQQIIDHNTSRRQELHWQDKDNNHKRVERGFEDKSAEEKQREWNFWHLRDQRIGLDQLWFERKEMSLSRKRLEDMKHAAWERMQLPNYRQEKMAFYNPTEIALIFAAHQMAQNYMQGFNSVSAIDMIKYSTGEAGIRTVVATNPVKSY